jgi:hypothetical protein
MALFNIENTDSQRIRLPQRAVAVTIPFEYTEDSLLILRLINNDVSAKDIDL